MFLHRKRERARWQAALGLGETRLPSDAPAAARADRRAGSAGHTLRPNGPGRSHGDERATRLEGKLREIILDEVSFDGLPVTEVLRFVRDESRKHDPEKKGINFLIKPNQMPLQSNPAAVDPAAGLPQGP